MQKSSTRFLIFPIYVMAIVAIFVSALLLTAHQFVADSELNIDTAAVSNANFSYGTSDSQISNYYFNTDGQSQGAISGNAIGDASSLKNALRTTKTGSFYLTSDIVWEEAFDDANTFNGTIDGRGHTITISGSTVSYGGTDYKDFGALTSHLGSTGIIKNTKFVISSVNVYASEKEKGAICVGALFGGCDNGSQITNCYITYDCNEYLYWTNRSDRDGATTAVGIISGYNNGTTFTNVTIDIKSDYKIGMGQWHWGGHDGNRRIAIGTFFGWSNYNTPSLINCSLYSNRDILMCNHIDGNGGRLEESDFDQTKGYYGLVCGLADNTISINGFTDAFCGEYHTIDYSTVYTENRYVGWDNVNSSIQNVTTINPYINDGYGLEDGYVAESVISYDQNTGEETATNPYNYYHKMGYDAAGSGWTAISTANEFNTNVLGATSGNFYLTTNLTLGNISTYKTSEFRGKLDGCGCKVTFSNTGSTYSNSNSITAGSWFGTLYGTIKNIRCEYTFYFTKNAGRHNANDYWGGIVGSNTGYIYNCSFKLSGYGDLNTSNSVTGTYQKVLGGIAGTQTDDGKMENVTFDVNNQGLYYTNSTSQYLLNAPNYNACLGFFVGYINDAGGIFKNISLYGTGKIHGQGNGRDNERTHFGGIVGYVDGGRFSIDGLKYAASLTFTAISNSGNTKDMENIYTEGSGVSKTLINFYSKNGFSYGRAANTSPTITAARTYHVDNNRIGLKSSYVWLGQLSSFAQSNANNKKTITGKFVNTITFNISNADYTINVSAYSALGGLNAPCVPRVAKSNVDSTIKSYTFNGQYGFVANEAFAISKSGGPTLDEPSNNVFTGTYNSNPITAISGISEKIYFNNTYSNDNLALTSWSGTLPIKDAGNYDFTSTISNQYANIGGTDYYLISTGSNYTARISIQRSSTALSYDTSYFLEPQLTYNGKSQAGVTVNAANIAQAVSSLYTGDYATTADELIGFSVANDASNSNDSTNYKYDASIASTGSFPTNLQHTASGTDARYHYPLGSPTYEEAYRVTLNLQFKNYTDRTITIEFTIDPAIISPESETTSFEYDGNAHSALPELPQGVSVTLTYYAGTHLSHGDAINVNQNPTKNVGQYCIKIEGNASNHNYIVQSGWLNYVIYPKVITPTLVQKTYDRTNTMLFGSSSMTFSGMVGGDTQAKLGFANGDTMGTYASTNIATYTNVTFANGIFTDSLILMPSVAQLNAPWPSNADNLNDGSTAYTTTYYRINNSNYALNAKTNFQQNSQYIGYITPRALGVSSVTKVYDSTNTMSRAGSNGVNASTITYSDLISGDSITGETGTYENETVGAPKQVTFVLGNWGRTNEFKRLTTSNYYIANNGVVSGVGSITKAAAPTFAMDAFIITGLAYTGDPQVGISINTSTITGYTYPIAGDTVARKAVSSITLSNNTGTSTFNASNVNPRTASATNPGTYIVNYTISFANYQDKTGTMTYTISPMTIVLQLNDVIELYDSRLDNTTIDGQMYYDFIYVKGDTRLPASFAESPMFSDPWLGNSDYRKYFGFNSASTHALTQAGVTATVGDVNYVTTPSRSTVGEHIFYFNVTLSGANASCFNVATSQFMAASGSASSKYSRSTSVSATTTSGIKCRLKIITDQNTVSGAPQMTNYNSVEDFTNSSTGTLMAFMSSRYYDTTTPDGFTGTVQTYAQATIYQLTGNVIYNHQIAAYRIMPAYKTIDGYYNGTYHEYQTTWVGDLANQIMTSTNGGKKFENTIAPTTNITIDGDTYYAASDFASINYGVIKNINFVINGAWHGFQAFTNYNTIYGIVAGINYGIIENVNVDFPNDVISIPQNTYEGDGDTVLIFGSHDTFTSGLLTNSSRHAIVGGVAGVNYGGTIKVPIKEIVAFKILTKDKPHLIQKQILLAASLDIHIKAKCVT